MLDHIYTVHPPKTGQKIENEITEENIKTSLKKAITHYHSDKQVTYERKWQVLSGEITKHLTNAYESFK